MINRIVFSIFCCSYLSSCNITANKPPNAYSRAVEATKVTEPMIHNAPKLQDFIELYGDQQGGRIYVRELKNYHEYLSFYIQYLSKQYDIPVYSEKSCIYPPTEDGIRIPMIDEITDSSPEQIINRLAIHIGKVTRAVDEYNKSLSDKYDEYKSCIN